MSLCFFATLKCVTLLKKNLKVELNLSVSYSFLQLQSLLESRKWGVPGHAGWSGDWLEDDLSSSSVLILDEDLGQGPLGLRRLGEELGVTQAGLVITIKVGSNRLQ